MQMKGTHCSSALRSLYPTQFPTTPSWRSESARAALAFALPDRDKLLAQSNVQVAGIQVGTCRFQLIAYLCLGEVLDHRCCVHRDQKRREKFHRKTGNLALTQKLTFSGQQQKRVYPSVSRKLEEALGPAHQLWTKRWVLSLTRRPTRSRPSSE